MYLIYHQEGQPESYLAKSKRKFEEHKKGKGIDSCAEQIVSELKAQTRMSWEKLNRIIR